jgi:hypothetical protein
MLWRMCAQGTTLKNVSPFGGRARGVGLRRLLKDRRHRWIESGVLVLQSFLFARVRLDEAVERALNRSTHLGRHAVVVEDSVEMVVLVLEDACFEPLEGHLEFFTLEILRLDLYPQRTLCDRGKNAEKSVDGFDCPLDEKSEKYHACLA